MTKKSLVVMQFEHISGLPKDRVINAWAIESNDAWNPTTELGEVTTQLAAFYNGGANSIASHMSPGISRAAGAVQMKLYDVGADLNGTPHGSPYATDSMTLGETGSGTPIPEEVAMVLTLRGEDWQEALVETPDGADPGGAVDRPRQRRSGRIFLGPFNVAAMADVTDRCRPSQFLIDQALERIQNLALGLGNNGHWVCVWSRVDGAFYRITHAQVDNAFDTQRRRGVEATVRTTVTTPSA